MLSEKETFDMANTLIEKLTTNGIEIAIVDGKLVKSKSAGTKTEPATAKEAESSSSTTEEAKKSSSDPVRIKVGFVPGLVKSTTIDGGTTLESFLKTVKDYDEAVHDCLINDVNVDLSKAAEIVIAEDNKIIFTKKIVTKPIKDDDQVEEITTEDDE